MVERIVRKAILCSVMFCIFSSAGLSQNYSSIKGVVIDSKNSDPIPFATVAFKDRSFGVITNEDGSFTLPISVSDTVRQFEISCLGYESRVINIQGIEADKLLTYSLSPILYDIEEVEVAAKKQKAKSAGDIVSQAVKSISSNYSNSPFLLDGYYRDYLKTDDGYVNMYEAMVQVQDNGFSTVEQEQARVGLTYGAINRSFPTDSNMITNYGNHKIVPYGETGYTGGNELYFLLLHNPIRNYLDESFDFIKRIQYEFLDDHRFTLLGIEYIDSVLCYKIAINYTKSENPKFSTGSVGTVGDSFKQFRNNYRATGLIFIQADNFRIHNLSYQVFFRELRLWELNVSYKDVAGVFYLNYLSFNNLIETPNYLDKHFFYLNSLSVDKRTKQVNLFFNNPVDSKSVKKHRDFRLKFDGNRIKISSVEATDKGVTLSVEDFDRSLGSFEIRHSDRLDFVIKNIRDVYGNKINDLKTTRAYQYREFFVKNATIEFDPIPEDKLLDLEKSIIVNHKTQHAISDTLKFNSPLIGRN